MKSTRNAEQHCSDYNRIEKAIDYLNRNYPDRPNLESLAQHLKLNPFHLQRLFRRWAGISPKQFIGYLTLQQAKNLLIQSRSVLDTVLDSGLLGPGRLHDLFVTMDAVTPGEFKILGRGLTLSYGIHATSFGVCLIAVTARGICHLSFAENLSPVQAEKELSREWKNARLVRNQQATGRVVRQIFGPGTRGSLRLFLKGTNFQIKVWEALLKIPMGSVISYEDLAAAVKKPTAARAVSRAVASNPIAYLIPCHRVIHKNGVADGYRWNSRRKKAILLWEQSRTRSTTGPLSK